MLSNIQQSSAILSNTQKSNNFKEGSNFNSITLESLKNNSPKNQRTRGAPTELAGILKSVSNLFKKFTHF